LLGNEYNDVIFIDSTYKILSKKTIEKAKDKTCLALITAVNKNGKTSLLAAALMSKENKLNYEFLLKCYESIGFRKPLTVITDQHLGLIAAVEEQWKKSVKHHLCLFHIYRDIQKRLGKEIIN